MLVLVGYVYVEGVEREAMPIAVELGKGVSGMDKGILALMEVVIEFLISMDWMRLVSLVDS